MASKNNKTTQEKKVLDRFHQGRTFVIWSVSYCNGRFIKRM